MPGFAEELVRFVAERKALGMTYREIQEEAEREFGRRYNIDHLRHCYAKAKERASAVFSVDGVTFQRVTLDAPEATIVPIADIHASDREGLARAIAHVSEREPEARLAFLGDLIQMDVAKPGIPYGKLPTEEVLGLFDALRGVASRTVALVPGNHEHRLAKVAGVDISRVAAETFGIPYAPAAMLLQLRMKGHTKTIYMLHGNTGGRRAGSKANRLEDLVHVCDADAYVVAHSHEFITFERRRITFDGDLPAMRTVAFVNVPSRQGYPAYAAKAGYPVGADGFVALKVSPAGISVTRL